MAERVIPIIVVAVVVGLATVLVELVAGRWRPGFRGGMPSIAAGASLLLFGVFLTFGGPRNPLLSVAPLNRPLTRVFVRETVCWFGGTLLVVCGAVCRLGAAASRREVSRLDDQLTIASNERNAAREVLTSVVRTSVSGVLILRAARNQSRRIVDFTCQFMNDEAERLLRHQARQVLNQRLAERVPALKVSGLLQEAITVLETRRPFRDERRFECDDLEHWYQIAMVKHEEGVIATFTDISDRKRAEKKLRHVAKHDALTDLPSRSQLIDRLAQAITLGKRLPGYKFAVLLLDFDDFKVVNDSLGHKLGDRLLMGIAQRIVAGLREIDTPARVGAEHLAARLGGDEFVVLLDGVADARAALSFADRLQESLAAPHVVAGHEVISKASMGLVICEGGYQQPEDILRDADTAMYQAKNAGKGRCVIFDEHMHTEALDRLTLEKDLRLAARDNAQFKLNYQPIVVLETSCLKGFEALIRWHHPERGMVRPDQFITLAEELGLIVPIGEWVMREAAGQLERWQEQRPGQPLSMTVNLSKKQLVDPGLLDTVAGVLRDVEIEPSSFVLEITESTIMDNLDALTPTLESLRGLGVRLAMDDFGTGHSSLSFLYRVPMDILKVDRSFVMKAGEGRKFDALIETIIRLAQNFDMEVVAEGVETVEQLALLQKLRCNYCQGYLFAKPLPAPEAEALLGGEYRFSRAA